MKINEIFYSIQGEGSRAGLPNIFIRTTGCNLRCSFCDTIYAYDEGTEMTNDAILQKIETYPCSSVCITGGEPLLQKDIVDLISGLLKKKYDISVESNGSIPLKSIAGKKHVMISLDIKCPSSEMHMNMCFENLSLLTKNDQVKFIINTKDDYEYAKTILLTYKPLGTIFFQPVWGTDPRKLANWILHDGLSVRLGVQLHKIVFGNARGI